MPRASAALARTYICERPLLAGVGPSVSGSPITVKDAVRSAGHARSNYNASQPVIITFSSIMNASADS